ncbi:hypothetical protein DPMN_052182 [Dreissena polymorpha]|uniref:Uncharacterized protein n=1 Tax=Dreissena polymorpha TaxID=45954 RepID=A0A9D4CLF9_DREPO|nr:hypothetical protein DPMN_052182 [Dreissena polymorpha]
MLCLKANTKRSVLIHLWPIKCVYLSRYFIPVPYRCLINTDHVQHDPACEPCSRRVAPYRSGNAFKVPGGQHGSVGTSKQPCSSVTFLADDNIRDSPCSCLMGFGDSRTYALVVRVGP